MQRKSIPVLVILAVCVLCVSAAVAKTADEYVKEAGDLYFRKEFGSAAVLLEEAVKEYPLDTDLRYMLVDTYNELGQQHYFSPELCLRIIYHAEKFLESDATVPDKNEIIEFLRKTIGHYEVSTMGPNVQMMEEGGDGKPFELPPDSVSEEEKLQYKETASRRVKDFDKAQKEAQYVSEPSDKSPQELVDLINAKRGAVSSVHYKKTNTYGGKEELLSEIFYKQPDKAKIMGTQKAFVFTGGTMYSINLQSGAIEDKTSVSLENDVDILKDLYLNNFHMLQEYFSLNAEKISGCPEFLKDLYAGGQAPFLYVVNAVIKDKEKTFSYPPIIRMEFFIDTNLELVVGLRNYCFGIVGSGKEEELSEEMVVKKVEKYGDNFYLPAEGSTRGLIKELENEKEDWKIEIFSFNQEIPDSEFKVEGISQ